MPQDTVITARGLRKSYGNTLVLDGLDFDVRRGGLTAMLGPNGAGKTTTLAILLGLLEPDGGSVRVLGEDVLRHRYRVLPRMNFLSPYVDMPQRLTVRENLTVYARLYGVRGHARRLEHLAEELDLLAHLDAAYGTLSAGQRTRVALVKAMMNEPELLLLDEPTASLDPDVADRVRNYLLAYCRQRQASVLLTSHNMREVELLCEHVLMLRGGRVFDQGSPRALSERHGRGDLEQLFLAMAREHELTP